MSDLKKYIKNNIFQLSKKIDKLKDEEIIFEIQNNLIDDKLKEISKDINSHPFKIVSSKDVVAKKPNFLIEDILPIQENEINIISSSGGVGKSTLALFILLKIKETEGKRVFGYFSEDSLPYIKDRLERISKGDVDIDILGRETQPQSFLKLDDSGRFVASDFFKQFKIAMKSYDVIVIDPLLAFLFVNENNNIEARAFMNLFNRWAEEENKTFIFLHHTNKENNVRGATDFINAARIHYQIRKNKEGGVFCSLLKENYLPDFKQKVINLHNSLVSISHYGKFEDKKIKDETKDIMKFDEVIEVDIITSSQESGDFFDEVGEDYEF